MADVYRPEGRGKQHWADRDRDRDRDSDQQQYYKQRQQGGGQSWAYQLAKGATSAFAGGSLLVLSGLTLAGTVIALTVATPVMVLFSPVLVPAVAAVFLFATGFLAAGGFAVAAVTVLTWMFRYVTSDRQRGGYSFDQTTHKLGAKGREHGIGGGSYATGGIHHTTGA